MDRQTRRRCKKRANMTRSPLVFGEARRDLPRSTCSGGHQGIRINPAKPDTRPLIFPVADEDAAFHNEMFGFGLLERTNWATKVPYAPLSRGRAITAPARRPLERRR